MIWKPPVTRRKCRDCPRRFRARYARWCPGCRWRHRGKPAKYVWTPERDRVLCEKYDGRKGTPARIAASFGWPSWAVKRRAAVLGLTRPPVDRRPWTAEEQAFLEEHAGTRLAAFMANKLHRSVTSVVMKLKHLHVSRRIRDGYTLRDLELCFGVDHHLIHRWIREGKLAGSHRHGGSAPAFERDAWRFTDEDVQSFIRDHPTAFELRRVDQVWFLDLAFGSPRERRSSAA